MTGRAAARLHRFADNKIISKEYLIYGLPQDPTYSVTYGIPNLNGLDQFRAYRTGGES